MDDVRRGIHRRTAVSLDGSIELRFRNRVIATGDDECWPWNGAIRNGYGCLKQHGKLLSAHVVAWVIANKRQIRDGMIICHTCDNRICCNPRHLYEGTFQQNAIDADDRRKTHAPHGNELPHCVLRESEVLVILAMRVRFGWGYRRISRQMQISEWNVDSVIRRKSWKHVDVPSI